jgi:hypothetical protein
MAKRTKVSKPMVVSIEQTRSLGEKASLRKLLEQWRGQTFTAAELKAFSLKNLLGKPAMLTLIHKTSQAGRQYCAIAGAIQAAQRHEGSSYHHQRSDVLRD